MNCLEYLVYITLDAGTIAFYYEVLHPLYSGCRYSVSVFKLLFVLNVSEISCELGHMDKRNGLSEIDRPNCGYYLFCKCLAHAWQCCRRLGNFDFRVSKKILYNVFNPLTMFAQKGYQSRVNFNST